MSPVISVTLRRECLHVPSVARSHGFWDATCLHL